MSGLAMIYGPIVSPLALLGIVVAIAIVVTAFRRAARRKRVGWLTALAREWRMTFSPADRFDLTPRLAALPEWAPQAIDLLVTDVLYAAHGSTRRFVATATYRRTRDEEPHRFVFACAERLPDNELDLGSIRLAHGRGADEARYREVLALEQVEIDQTDEDDEIDSDPGAGVSARSSATAASVSSSVG